MKPALILIVLASSAFAGDFKLAIGSPIAASIPGTDNGPRATKVKGAVFALRTEGCADPAKAQIAATAEGLVNGMRQSLALKLLSGGGPGVYLISQEWPPQGAWVVSLNGSCEGAKAGAVVPVGPQGYLRESSKFFPRSTTEADIDASLKSLTGGSK